MHRNKEDLIYLAGLFDGEGHITISKSPSRENPNWNPFYYLTIGITNTDKQILEWAKAIFGVGNVKLNSKSGVIGNSQNCYSWNTTCNKARFVLNLLVPYLRIKIDRAILGIEFQDRKVKFSKIRPIPDNEIEYRETTRTTMRGLNGRSGKLVVTKEQNGK